jgi:uncharacterized protein YjbI with pentapeptide repeats
MNSLSKIKIFKLDINENYTCKDLSYTLFKDIDFSSYTPISFFRSDFRGSRFENVKFQNNCFDRADFIGCTFINCTFINVDFAACEIKSCLFLDGIFQNCKFNNTSIQESSFTGCEFSKQHLLVNMKNCKMIHSKIQDCTFERSTTEKIKFECCTLNNTDFATMHAECHKFISCNLNKVKLDISYVFGYLLSNTNIRDFEVLYRGKKVNLNSQEEALKFVEESRTYELINLFFIYQGFDKIPQILEKVLVYLYNNFTPTNRSDIQNIFEALVFYTTQDITPYNCFIDCLRIINSFVLPELDLEDELLFVGYKEKLNYIISDGLYGKKFIASSSKEVALITIHIQTEDYEEALNLSNSFLEKLCQSCNLTPNWELIESRKGSWILTFAVSAMVIVILPKIIKNYYNLISEIQIQKEFKKKIIQKLQDNTVSIEIIDKLADVVGKLQLDKQSEIDIPKQISEIKAFL